MFLNQVINEWQLKQTPVYQIQSITISVALESFPMTVVRPSEISLYWRTTTNHIHSVQSSLQLSREHAGYLAFIVSPIHHLPSEASAEELIDYLVQWPTFPLQSTSSYRWQLTGLSGWVPFVLNVNRCIIRSRLGSARGRFCIKLQTARVQVGSASQRVLHAVTTTADDVNTYSEKYPCHIAAV